jgi:hypothetical protein
MFETEKQVWTQEGMSGQWGDRSFEYESAQEVGVSTSEGIYDDSHKDTLSFMSCCHIQVESSSLKNEDRLGVTCRQQWQFTMSQNL